MVRQGVCYLEMRVLCLSCLITLFCIASPKPVEDEANLNFEVTIPESSKPGKEVFNFQDSLGDNVHTFQILSGNKDDRFKISPNGTLVTKGFLDCDIVAHYKLNISFMEDSRQSEAMLGVNLLNESDWPPYYNSTCETPVYTGPPTDPSGYLLFDCIIGEAKLRTYDFEFLDIIFAADTNNGHCGGDLFLDLFDPFDILCDLNYKFKQLEGPPIPQPKVKIYNDRNTFPRNFSNDPSLLGDCIGELHLQHYSTSAPVGMLISVVPEADDVIVYTIQVEVITQGCPEGRYGFLCDNDCICQNGATCHGFNGACKCSKGWTGPACDIASKEIWILHTDGEPIYGQGFDLSCHYNFEINSAYGTIWTFFNGSSSRILQGPREHISNEPHSSRLKILHFNEERVGSYKCSVTDQDGAEYTAEATVTYAGCAENLFGDFCNSTCDCKHALRCDRSLGCICLDGWTGKTCAFDIQAPNITNCPMDQTVLAEVDSNSAIVSWTNPTIIDNSGQPILLESTRESGERFSIGNYDIFMWAWDQSNNTALCNFSVIVAGLEENGGTKYLPVYVWSMILTSMVVIILILLVYIAKKQWPYVSVDGNDREFEDYLQEHLPKEAFAWNVERKALKILEDEPIGVGEYGRVYKARLRINGRERVVAAKTLCETRSDATSRKNFVNEVRCLLELACHPNVISFLGIHITGEPKYILTEYASNGDLKNYLISLTLLSTGSETVLIKVARDIAKALSFMFTKGVMHKDIAARNVFLTKDFTAKIGDFGLGRDVYERLGSDYHSLIWVNQNCRFPVRWMPPEFLVEGRFSLEGDRWSYGILLWEIGSLGGSPMMDVPVESLLEYLQQGNRPIKPEGCTHRAYQIMQRCWHEDRYKRPTPDQLIAEFEYMLRTQVNISQRFFTEAFKERFSNRTSDQYSSMDELNDLND